MAESTIPAMTHPHGQSWRQPSRQDILVDKTHALMSWADFEKLHDYSTSLPSGVYEGKMWRCEAVEGWYLCWYGPSTMRDRWVNNFRKILIVEEL